MYHLNTLSASLKIHPTPKFFNLVSFWLPAATRLTKVGLIVTAILSTVACLVRKRHEVRVEGDGFVGKQLGGTAFPHRLEFQEAWTGKETML